MSNHHSHPQIKVQFGESAKKVDSLLSPLINEMFQAKIHILDCCQGYESSKEAEEAKSYLDIHGSLFANLLMVTDDALKFVEVILDDFGESPEGRSLYKRIVVFRNNYSMKDKISKISKSEWEKVWSLETEIHDMGEAYQAMMLPLTKILFPISDLPYLIKKLDQYNELEELDDCQHDHDCEHYIEDDEDEDESCINCGGPLDSDDDLDENDFDNQEIGESDLENFTQPLEKLELAFQKLNAVQIYVCIKDKLMTGTGISSEENSVVLNSPEKSPGCRGVIFWDRESVREVSEAYPVLHLHFIAAPVGDEPWPATRQAQGHLQMSPQSKKKALEVTKEVVQIFTQLGLKVHWNGCVCRSFDVILVGEFETEAKPCICEEVWEQRFAQYAEEQLKKKGQNNA